jgi:triosephosphate isomerase
MARTLVVAANWKMNTTVDEALALVGERRADLEAVDGVERILCPPFVSLASLRGLLADSPLRLGAQNMYFEPKGAFTGEISPLMLAPLVDYVIVGHSERRHIFGEPDEWIGRKVQAALAHDLRPILCVGETLAENEAGQTASVIARQVRTALTDVTGLERVLLAYEPVWAIGTGRPATPAGANAVMGEIRALLADLYGPAAAQATSILYGGSVTLDNFASFVAEPEIDGGLVGGASLQAHSFLTLARQAQAAAAQKGALK